MLDEGLVKILEDLKSDFKTRFDAQEGRFMELKALLTGVQAENIAFKRAMEKKESEIMNLKRRSK